MSNKKLDMYVDKSGRGDIKVDTLVNNVDAKMFNVEISAYSSGPAELRKIRHVNTSCTFSSTLVTPKCRQ